MNRDDVIRMARQHTIGGLEFDQDGLIAFFQAAYAAGAAAERENSLRLWMLLDDVDTADDIAKSDDAVYRSLCRQAHQKRWAVMTGDEVDAAIRAKGETK